MFSSHAHSHQDKVYIPRISGICLTFQNKHQMKIIEIMNPYLHASIARSYPGKHLRIVGVCGGGLSSMSNTTVFGVKTDEWSLIQFRSPCTRRTCSEM